MPTSKEQNTECWLSKQFLDKGYARVLIRGKRELVHRVSYILFNGRIPPGKQIDHLCRVRNCFNPNHLEAVWPKDNILRGQGFAGNNARKTHCHVGHPLSGENLRMRGSQRVCRMCKRDWARRIRSKNANNS